METGVLRGKRRRIVVTGVGVVTAIGVNRVDFWSRLASGTIGIGPVTRFDTADFDRHNGGEIHGFDVTHFFPSRPELARLGRAKQLMLVAAKECLEDAGLDLPSIDPFRVGVAIGTTMGESQALEAWTDTVHLHQNDDRVLIDIAREYPPYTIPQAVARVFGLYGPNVMLSNACAAGSFSMGYALQCIRSGSADAMLAGGADAFSRYVFSGFCRLGAVSPDVPRPFSLGRKGMIPGEGAGAILLEDYETARARGATIYAEIAGYGESCDAHHITHPHEEGVAQAIRTALADGELEPRQISYISAHGTGTPTNDVTEVRALNSVFGERVGGIPVSAVKSMIGHSMGAASTIECVAALLSMKHQFLVPTANFEAPDPECDVDCVPNQGRPAKVDHVLKTSSAFGGNNACLVFRSLDA